MSCRELFEAHFPTPPSTFYNAKFDAYCWLNYPNTPNDEYNGQWEAWKAGFAAKDK